MFLESVSGDDGEGRLEFGPERGDVFLGRPLFRWQPQRLADLEARDAFVEARMQVLGLDRFAVEDHHGAVGVALVLEKLKLPKRARRYGRDIGDDEIHPVGEFNHALLPVLGVQVDRPDGRAAGVDDLAVLAVVVAVEAGRLKTEIPGAEDLEDFKFRRELIPENGVEARRVEGRISGRELRPGANRGFLIVAS